MIIDMHNPSTVGWDRQLTSDHERLNYPDVRFEFLMRIANRLLKLDRIENPRWRYLYDASQGARGGAPRNSLIKAAHA
ncbi:MAG TPA: hypothetical protein DCP19_12045 [Pseudomonas sp.]|nr:hypothetical protein [Pseudomonas sp.]